MNSFDEFELLYKRNKKQKQAPITPYWNKKG